jgi:thioredoxin reductase (NADPH)
MTDISLSLDINRLKRTKAGKQQEQEDIEREMVIIGAGPAGLSAGLYGARAILKPLILVGPSLGGQAATTNEMENYPGFPEGIGGLDLAEQMAAQARRFGAEIAYEEVTAVDLSAYPFVLKTHGPLIRARSMIICTGTSPRLLGIPGEKEFWGRGVSTCATCDGFFYRDKTVVVVGGGDSALDEGIFLTRFAREVIIVHRRDRLRAGPTLVARANSNSKIRFVWNTVLDEIVGDQAVTGVRGHDVMTGENLDIPCDGVFIYVGLIPNTQLFRDQLEMDKDGYIVTDKWQRTSVEGVFAAGDVQDPWFRQVVIAAGSGAAAAIEAERFLSEKAFEEQQQQVTD